MTRTELSPAQIKQLLQNPPAGVDPIIWEQAKVDNPDSEKLIPVPMVGFKELLRRLKVQDQMTKQHQTRLDVRVHFLFSVLRVEKKRESERDFYGV